MQFLLLIILIIVLIAAIRSNFKGVQKRIKPKSFIILPLLIILYLYGIFKNSHQMSLISYIILVVALIIGCLIGNARAKSYSFTVNADGDVFYRKEILDAIILIALLISECIIKLIFKTYENNLYTLVNTSLIVMTTGSIVVRRIVMFLKYREIKKRL